MLQSKNLEIRSQSTLTRVDGNFEISIYSGEITKLCVFEMTAKLKKSFSTLPIGFYDVLFDRVKDSNFNDQRQIDSVNHVVDNCIYPQPTVAQFLQYDLRIKLYSYKDMVKLVNTDPKAFEKHAAVLLPDGKSLWASLEDIETYKLTKYEKQ